MKLSFSIITALVAVASSAIAAPIDPEKATGSINFVVDYKISELPEITNTDVAELTNGEAISLQYSVENNEDKEISIVGVGGSFRDPANGNIKTNLTGAAVGPVLVPAGEKASFIQKIEVNLVADNYLLTPQIFVAVEDDLKFIQARGQLASVNDLPISFFNPQLLFLEAILVATLGGILYVVYDIWGKKYIEGTAPIIKTSKKASSPSPISVATGKSYNSEWIPEAHLKQKKSKKAY
mmetsp:Transcript_1897/g.1865  ORF Transcript_1897/g.1865 Transcript_1897/m.1865 type:complete len:238 (+) Transcript_1897:51-764(+)